MELLVGADPEVFLLSKDKTFISAYGKIPGTKMNPHKVEKGAVQVDGMALEFNIDPAKNEFDFIHNIQTVMKTLSSMIPEDTTIQIDPVAYFSQPHMDDQPSEALELGCDPDYNAYTGKLNKAIKNPGAMRAAGGHIHLGWSTDEDPGDKAHFNQCSNMAKQLDYYLGIPSLLLDSDTSRRKQYGKAGSFRPKPYGMEYRVLSNFWLKDERLIKWVFYAVQMAFEKLAIERFGLFDLYRNMAKDAIHYSERRHAWSFLERVDDKSKKKWKEIVMGPYIDLLPEDENPYKKRTDIRGTPPGEIQKDWIGPWQANVPVLVG